MINLGIFKQAKYRILIWFFLIATVLLFLKFTIAEPFPKIHQQIISLGAVNQYEDIPALVKVGRDVYHDRYFATQLGFHHAEALKKVGKLQDSQKYLLEYMEVTTVNLHHNTQRLLADNYLELKEIDKGLKILSQLYKLRPQRNIAILKEIETYKPNYDVAPHLDPAKDKLALDVFNAYKVNKVKSQGFNGEVKLPQGAPQPMKNSLFFTVGHVKTLSKGSQSLITGEISSRIDLSLMGFRLKAQDSRGLYLDEQDCTVDHLQKGKGTKFNCTLNDGSPIKTLTFQELRYEI